MCVYFSCFPELSAPITLILLLLWGEVLTSYSPPVCFLTRIESGMSLKMAVFPWTWEFGLPLFCLDLLIDQVRVKNLTKLQSISYTGSFQSNVFGYSQIMSLLGDNLVCSIIRFCH